MTSLYCAGSGQLLGGIHLLRTILPVRYLSTRDAPVSQPGTHLLQLPVPWVWGFTLGIPGEKHPGHWSQRHEPLHSSVVSEQPVQIEEEMKAEERGSDLVFLPPFPD